MHARVPQAMAQFVLEIEKLSHIIGTAPILEMARAFGLRPRLWLLLLDDPKRVSDDREKEIYPIMTMNMNGKSQGKGTADKRRKLIISVIKRTSASVIFCQEVPGFFEKEVVARCGTDGNSYKFLRPKDVCSKKRNVKVAVMWRETDFQGKEVDLTDVFSFTKTVESLKKKKFDVDVNKASIRFAMAKLTSRRTKASFLAVSWHGPRKVNKASKKTKLEDLIRLLRVVCEKEELSSFIIGGDFNFNTSKVNDDRQTEYGVTILRYELCTRDKKQRGSSFVPYKDTLIFSVPSDKPPMTGDITVSSVAPLELENESGENALLDHVPVVGDLEIVWPYKKPSIKQDRGKLEQ